MSNDNYTKDSTSQIDNSISGQANQITIDSINQLNFSGQNQHGDRNIANNLTALHKTRTYSITKSPLLKVVPPINFCPVERQLYRSGQPTAINHSFLKQLKIKNIVWLAAEDPNDDLLQFAHSNNIVLHYVGAMTREPTSSENLQNTNQSAHNKNGINNKDSIVPAGYSKDKLVDERLLNITATTLSLQQDQHSLNPVCTDETDEEEDDNDEENEDDDYDNERLDTTALTPWDGLSESTIIQALSIITNKNNYPLLVCCGMGRHRTGTVIGCLRRLQGWNFASVSEEYRRFTGLKGGRILVELLIESFDIGNVKINEKVAPSWLI